MWLGYEHDEYVRLVHLKLVIFDQKGINLNFMIFFS